ncbi:MAG: hypothetical protein L0Y62_07810 [Nitrospirae bacterium]|nr:hypothetical protein [Nitrospirota bacterium]
MKLGILVNTDNHLEDILGITNAALIKGHEVIIFCMDDGVKLFGRQEFRVICKLRSVKMSFCDYSIKLLDIKKDEIPPEIVCGSQYDNAFMFHNSDRVIAL